MVSVFFFGLIFSFVGYTPPSLLNMTALKIRLQQDKRNFYYFTFGVLLVVLCQTYIALYLTKYIADNPMFISLLEKIGIGVLLFLSIYFYRQNKREKRETNTVKQTKNSFFTGMLLSVLNMFAIPFYCGIIAFLVRYNLMDYHTNSVILFVVGSVLGTFYILFLYGKYASKIEEKTGSMTQNINLILCCITASFAVFTFLKFVV